ncbi:MAG: glycosyltransferase family A protein [Myxococcota bacterium]
MDGPLVTVLVCTFNRATLIADALRSALAQTWPCEVLVVDDGSTDGTPEVLAGFDGVDGVRVLRQEPNQGKPAALARGLAAARGEAILVLDDDDLLLPGAVEVLARALFAAPSRVAVWADTVVFDDDTGLPFAVRPACRLPATYARRAVLQQVPGMPGATLVRTSAWREVGPCDPSLVRGQDMDLFLALSMVGEMVGLPLPTFFYRSHARLRGAAGGQWHKRDTATHRARFLSYVKPVFAQRYAEASPVGDRAEGHAWALGLWQRDLPDEARAELARWPGPYSEAEAFARETVGLRTHVVRKPGALLVVDDGDEGALEETLARQARGEALLVDLEVARDPLGNVRMYWPGAYGARERLGPWGSAVLRKLRVRGTWRVALTSAPGWAPGELDPRLLPDRPGPEALLAAAAVLGWAPPERVRPGLAVVEGPVSLLARRARRLLAAGDPAGAMAALTPLVTELPGWAGGWLLTAEAFRALGLEDEAAGCLARA